MLLMLNLTGLKEFHWRPWRQTESVRTPDGSKAWYYQVRWLGVEVCLYNRRFGNRVIDTISYSPKLEQHEWEQLAVIPKRPDLACLRSMALRYDHSFGMQSENIKQAITLQMRQLYEEVAGTGFYKHPPVEEMIKP